MISVRGLRKRYGTHEAVKGIDLEVGAGEIFGLLGTNGAGKTTTIEILEGYRTRTAGEVSCSVSIPPGRRARWRERIGLVLQESELDPVHGARDRRDVRPASTRARDVDDTITLVGLAENRRSAWARSRAARSAGSTSRSGSSAIPISCSSTSPPRGSTRRRRRHAWNMIRGLRDLGKTVVLTTHYMEEAQHLADRLAILRDGLVVGSGTPDGCRRHRPRRRSSASAWPTASAPTRCRRRSVSPRERRVTRSCLRSRHPAHAVPADQLGRAERRRAQGLEVDSAHPRRRVPRAHRRSRKRRSMSGKA